MQLNGAKKIFLLLLFLTIAFIIVIIGFYIGLRIPRKVNPAEVIQTECSISSEQIEFDILEWTDRANVFKQKRYNVTGRYDEKTKTLYVSAWLKASFTYASFRDFPFPNTYGEIEQIVLEGGLFNRNHKTVWTKTE